MAKLMRLFNLIVAAEPRWPGPRRALSLVKDILGQAIVFDTPKSLILLRVDNPYEAVEKLAANLGPEDPVLRAVPLDGETPAYVEDVAEAVRSLVEEKAGAGKPSFAIKIEGHLRSRETGDTLHNIDSVKIIAEGIDLPVNLDNPDLLVLVKVVRLGRGQRYAGIMVAPPGSIYSRARRYGA